MATGILSLLDDVASLMDDVATMSKVASKKVAGLLGDDLAVNVESATGFHASRELPVIWVISKGSMLNKIIILPVMFLLSALSKNLFTLNYQAFPFKSNSHKVDNYSNYFLLILT